MKVYSTHTGALIHDSGEGNVGIGLTDIDPDNIITACLKNGETITLDYCEVRAILQLLDRVVDMELFRTLIKDVEISDEAAMAASIRSFSHYEGDNR